MAAAAVGFILSPWGGNKNVIGLMKDKLGGRIMTNFVMLRPQPYTYKMISRGGDKKCMVKKTLDFDGCKHCLFAEVGENMY